MPPALLMRYRQETVIDDLRPCRAPGDAPATMNHDQRKHSAMDSGKDTPTWRRFMPRSTWPAAPRRYTTVKGETSIARPALGDFPDQSAASWYCSRGTVTLG